jgi:diguanylate cyclase (GGDEF)-like protein/PAS domain S-box-containing protein
MATFPRQADPARPSAAKAGPDAAGDAPGHRREKWPRDARDLPSLMLDSIGDGVIAVDVAGAVTYLNPAAAALTGWSQDAAAGRQFDEVFRIIDRETGEPSRDPLRLAMAIDTTVGLPPDCILVSRDDGARVAIEDSASPIRDADGQVIGAVIVFRGVGATLAMSRRMSHLAHHDAMTGLPNRLLLYDRLTEAIALGRRHRKPVAVGFLDIDGFKGVNDSLGHAVADRVLQSVAARLRESLRESDTVCRYGGDEFVVVLPEIKDARDAALVALKLLRSVATPFGIESHQVHLSASLGVSLYPDHGDDAVTLIARADSAMYEAKRSGRETYRFASPSSGASGICIECNGEIAIPPLRALPFAVRCRACERARSDSGTRGAPGIAAGRALDVHAPGPVPDNGVI